MTLAAGLLGLPPVQAFLLIPVLAVSSFAAASALRSRHAVTPAVVIAGLAALVVPILFWTAWRHATKGQARQQGEESRQVTMNEIAANRHVWRIAECARQHALEHPEAGYPSSLDAVGAAGAGCLVGQVANAPGYDVWYTPGLRDGSGRIRLFTICARPTSYAKTGRETYVEDERAERRGVGPSRPDRPTDSLSCAAAWPQEFGYFRSGVKHCVLRYAAEHPDRGYPDRIAEVGPAGSGCLGVEGRGIFAIEGDALKVGRSQYIYLPGRRDASGRITGFSIYLVEGSYSSLIDETGALRIRYDGGLVRRTDPTVEAAQQLRAAKGGADGANTARLERLCDDGKADACLDLGQGRLRRRAAVWPPGDRPTPDAGLDALSRACELGAAEGCLGHGRALAEETPSAHPAESCRDYERACVLGEGTGCWRSGKCLLDEDRSGARSRFERGCRAGASEACVAAAIMALAEPATARTSMSDVLGRLETACMEGDPAGCAPLARVYATGAVTGPDPERARYFGRRACALTADTEACEALRTR
jgi:hypothetical protein